MGSPSTSAHSDSEFWTIDLGSIHDLTKLPLFNSLQDATISISHVDVRLARDAVLTAEEMQRRVRLILEPWDERRILAVQGYDEHMFRMLKFMDGSGFEGESSTGGAGSGVAQPSQDETVFVSDQEDADGLEGAV
ncbi:hypothetical protein FOMPIDRAFT_1045147 [Fomitopsis schrenkii]|uniref:Uncharacterized protein n=1 Tax=Fomitopsis schrenkii TaxID=2126942 RepID=S8ELL3_FOMSC|nr:hypothetical protein FOMPIDRAFT_1045147 [Fomitopsis schrenkii]